MSHHPIPDSLLKSLRPDTFKGQHRDFHAEDWLVRFERYCKAAHISEDGQDRILCAGLLLTEGASRWFEQLGTITAARINNVDLTPYEVFKYKFRQRFVDTNDSENAFDQIRELRQIKSVNEYVTVFEKIRSRLTDFDDKDAVRFFRGGLKPDLRQLVDNHPDIADDDINGLIALAERLDKLYKHNRPFSQFNYKPRAPDSNKETYPQPMELDEARTQSQFQSKNTKKPTKEEVRKNDFSNNLCFYCHKTGHMINDCFERKKKTENPKAH